MNNDKSAFLDDALAGLPEAVSNFTKNNFMYDSVMCNKH
jgi:hypothetical protein